MSLLYTKSHLWLNKSMINGQIYDVGISEYLIKYLGEVVYINSNLGASQKFDKRNHFRLIILDSILFTLESSKASSEFVAPFSGKIICYRENKKQFLRLLNSYPESKGNIHI